MSPPVAILLILPALAALGWLLHWLLIRTEGVFLGRRIVVWLYDPVSYTHLRAHETVLDLVCRLLLEQKTHSCACDTS